MLLNDDLIKKSMPNAGRRLEPHLPFIISAMDEGAINTPERIAAFLAQVAHESGEYRYMEEIADGAAYEGRIDLGNVQPGDGKRHKGRGAIQITGRANYERCGRALGIDFIAHPELLSLPENATRSAVWFWTSGNGRINLNLLADRSWFRHITHVINGGENGFDDRIIHYQRNRALVGLPVYSTVDEDGSIRQFQSRKGLVVDGDAGPKTLAALKGEAS